MKVSAVFALMILLGSHRLYAETDLRALFRAESLESLFRTIDRQKRSSHEKMVCDRQLRAGHVPIACFSVLETDHLQLLNPERERDWLTDLCRERSRNSRDQSELREVSQNKILPVRCRTAASERAADLRYADQSEHPHQLFEQRLGKFTDREETP